MIDFAEQPGGQNAIVEAQEFVLSVTVAISEAKNKWILGVAKKHMPEFVSAWVDSGNKKMIRRATRWVEKNGFEIQEHPDGRCRFMKGEKVLSEFRIIIECGKVRFEKKDFE